MSTRTCTVYACRSNKGFSSELFVGYQDLHTPHEDLEDATAKMWWQQRWGQLSACK